jgi:hypothetical protein
MPSKSIVEKIVPGSPPRGSGIAKPTIRELDQKRKIARDAEKTRKNRARAEATPPLPPPPYPLDPTDHDAVVCFFLELFDLHSYSVQVGTMHWYDDDYQEFKAELRAKWGDQIPDESFSVMFRRGRELLEAKFPDEVARLRDSEDSLVIEDVDYSDGRREEPRYPTEDDKEDHAKGTYDHKALLCFFMEMFDAQRCRINAPTHWTEGFQEDVKGSIDPSWVGEYGDPNAKFTTMVRRGLEIVGEAFPDVFERLVAHDMMYEPETY